MSENQTPSKALVLFIHGTGSASPNSDYLVNEPLTQRFYQRGSPCWTALEGLLGPQAAMPSVGFWKAFSPRIIAGSIDHFGWTGNNSERERREAGECLYKVLKELEAQNVQVHLIGHSHGGSVIRAALNRGELRNVLSASCVGTPFIDFGPFPFGWRWIIACIAIAVCLIVPLVAIFQSLAEFTPGATGGTEAWNTLLTDVRWERFNRWAEALAQEHSPLVLILTPLVLIALLAFAGGLLAWITMCLTSWWRRRSRRLNQHVRWLMLFSSQDEAINGLILADRMSIREFIPRFPGIQGWIYNQLIAAPIDRIFAEFLRERSLGANCRGEFGVQVTRDPGVGGKLKFIQLDDEAMIRKANELAGGAVKQLRAEFAKSVATPGGSISNSDLQELVLAKVLSSTNGELVHNQYFDDPEVIRLLAKHIADDDLAVSRSAKAVSTLPPLPPASRKEHFFLRYWSSALAIGCALAVLLTVLFYERRVDRSNIIHVASKHHPESELMGHILAKKLRERGFQVDFAHTDYSSREMQQRAFAGEVDVYFEFTGSLFLRIGDQEKNPSDAPQFNPSPSSPEFGRWFAEERARNKSFAGLEPGDFLGVTSPYVLVMKSRIGGLYEQLVSDKVIEPANPTIRGIWKEKCPLLNIQQQLNFERFKDWINKSSRQVTFGLSTDLATSDEGPKALLMSLRSGNVSVVQGGGKPTTEAAAKIDVVDRNDAKRMNTLAELGGVVAYVSPALKENVPFVLSLDDGPLSELLKAEGVLKPDSDGGDAPAKGKNVFQFDLAKFSELRKAGLSLPINIALPSSLRAQTSAATAVVPELEPWWIKITGLEHHTKYGALNRKEVDFIDGYGTDPELYAENSSYVPVGLAALTDSEKKALSQFLIPYQGFPMVRDSRRAQRKALIAALHGQISQAEFAKLLDAFNTEVSKTPPGRTLKEPERNALRDKLISAAWTKLFTSYAPPAKPPAINEAAPSLPVPAKAAR